MRRKLLLLSVTMILCLSCAAQSVNFGLGMGANFSNLIGRGRFEDSKPRIGICPAVHIDIPLAYETFLEISALYSQQGVLIKTESVNSWDEWPADIEKKWTSLKVETRITKYIDYLTIPVEWKQTFGDIYVKAGPYASFALKATSKKIVDYSALKGNGVKDTSFTYDSSKDTTEAGKGYNQSFVNSLRQFDVGASLSIGLQTSISSGMDIFFNANYKIGFFSIDDSPNSKNAAIRNQVFYVSAGVFFVKNRRSKTYRRR